MCCFAGYALVVQFDRREMNRSPWVSVQCQDAMWRFDARMVTYRFPAQSVSDSIAFLVQWFCNGVDARGDGLSNHLRAAGHAVHRRVRRGESAPIDRDADVNGRGARRVLHRRGGRARMGRQSV